MDGIRRLICHDLGCHPVIDFLYYLIRPRALRAVWRLGGTFNAACWSIDYLRIQANALAELIQKQYSHEG